MNCEQASSSRSEGAGALTRLRFRLHRLRCADCRREAAQLRALDEALASVLSFTPPDDLLPSLLALPGGAGSSLPVRKEKTVIRRLAYAAAFLVLAGLPAGGLFVRASRPDARSILVSAAEAMEEVRSIHQSGRAAAGRELLPGRFEMWVTQRAIVTRYLDPESGMLLASSADVDALEWWFYDGRSQTLYQAALGPVADQATRAVAARASLFLAGRLQEVLTANWRDIQRTVTTERRNGHKIAVLTFIWERDLPLDPPQHVTDRQVYEVDTTTNRLLGIRRYFKYHDGSEVVIEDVDRIEYDVPVPRQGDLLRLASQVHVVPATAVADELHGVPSLVLKSGGAMLNEGSAFTTLEVPR